MIGGQPITQALNVEASMVSIQPACSRKERLSWLKVRRRCGRLPLTLRGDLQVTYRNPRRGESVYGSETRALIRLSHLSLVASFS